VLQGIAARHVARRLLKSGLPAQRRQARGARAPACARALAVELAVEIGGRYGAGGQPQHA